MGGSLSLSTVNDYKENRSTSHHNILGYRKRYHENGSSNNNKSQGTPTNSLTHSISMRNRQQQWIVTVHAPSAFIYVRGDFIAKHRYFFFLGVRVAPIKVWCLEIVCFLCVCIGETVIGNEICIRKSLSKYT